MLDLRVCSRYQSAVHSQPLLAHRWRLRGASAIADLSVVPALLVGLLCVVGGFARLGAVASFLSRPNLTGYMNGIALSIIAGQLESLLGYRVGPTASFASWSSPLETSLPQ